MRLCCPARKRGRAVPRQGKALPGGNHGDQLVITAAAAMVPCRMRAQSGAGPCSTDTATPVNTSDTPEWGSRVRPRYRRTVAGAWVARAPT